MPPYFFKKMRRLVLTTRATLSAALLLSEIVTGCGGDVTKPVIIRPQEVVKITIALEQSEFEPQMSVAIFAVALDAAHRELPQSAITWSSSNPDVATVEGDRLLTRVPGEVTISASAGTRSTSVRLKVAWRPGATLTVLPPLTAVEMGTTARFYLLVGYNEPEMEMSEWTSSDPGVVSVISPGVLESVAPGVSRISARYLGLETSFEVRVFSPVASSSFGYAYTGGAPDVEDYDVVDHWSSAPNLSYTTSGSAPWLRFGPPYPVAVDFGWLHPGELWTSLILHAVALGDARCYALNDPSNIPGTVFSCGPHMEVIAASADVFSGTIALVRPGLLSTTTTNVPVAERHPEPGMTEYTVPGEVRDDMYWFITPAKWGGAVACALLPARLTLAQVTAGVTCLDDAVNADRFPLNAIGFGDHAGRLGEARVFAELDTAGHVLRQSAYGIDLTAARISSGRMAITLSGARVGSYTRAPAVFLTAVSSNPYARCWMTQPVGMGSASVTVEITCDQNAEGFTFAALY